MRTMMKKKFGHVVILAFFIGVALLNLLLSLSFIQHIEKPTSVQQQSMHLVNCSNFQKANSSNVVSINRNGILFDMAIHDRKDIISMNIAKDGCFECPILDSLLNALKKAPNASFIDIGGNIGMYSLHAAALGRKVVAFEPFSINHERFCQSMERNTGFEDRISLFAVALTNDPSTKYLAFDKSSFSTAVYHRGRGQKNFGSLVVKKTNEDKIPPGLLGEDYAHSITIESIQTSDILPKPNSHIVLKVDVEGSECRALEGALGYLRKVHIEYVAIEWTPQRLKDCIEHGVVYDIFSLFTKNSLKPYMYEKSKNEWIDIDLNNWDSWLKSGGMNDFAFSKELPLPI